MCNTIMAQHVIHIKTLQEQETTIIVLHQPEAVHQAEATALHQAHQEAQVALEAEDLVVLLAAAAEDPAVVAEEEEVKIL